MVKQCHLVEKNESYMIKIFYRGIAVWVNRSRVSRPVLFKKKYYPTRSLTHLSAFVSNQGGEWLGVESAVAEAQASVHAVSCQLQSLLTDVVLMESQIWLA